MTTSTYKGKDVFVTNAGDQEIAMGGRGQEMTFGIADVDYSTLWDTERTISDTGNPNDGGKFNLVALPSDAIVAKSYGANVSDNSADGAILTLTASKKYVIRNTSATDDKVLTASTKDLNANALLGKILAGDLTLQDSAGDAVFSGSLADGQIVEVGDSAVALARSNTYGAVATWNTISTPGGTPTPGIYSGVTGTGGTSTSSDAKFNVSIDATGAITNLELVSGGTDYEVGETITIAKGDIGGPTADLTFVVATINTPSVHYVEVNEGATAFQAGESYTIQTLGTSDGNTGTSGSDAAFIKAAFTDASGNQLSGTLKIGDTIKMATVGQVIGSTTITQNHLDAANALLEGMTFTRATETLTADIEAIQALFNKARVQAGSQYAALESAVDYTTDLTAQYELGFNTVNDVNFSSETAHLAKNQILQQAATAMLAQANSGQQGLLQLIQG